MEMISWDDLNVVQTLRDKAAQFSNAYSYLLSVSPLVKAHPELATDYNNLISRGSTLRSAVTSLLTQIEGAIKTVESLIPGFSGLGIIPIIIPIAIIATTIALLGKWITDYITFAKKLQQIQEMVKGGLTPQQAVSVVSQAAETPGLLGQLISPQIGWIILGGLAIMVFASMKR